MRYEGPKYGYEEALTEAERMRTRVESGVFDNYDAADFITYFEQLPNAEVSEVTFEKLKNLVSEPGTLTHTTYNKGGETSPVAHWFKIATGQMTEHISQHSYFMGDTATSVNLTLPDGSNPSIEGGKYWSLIQRDGHVNPFSLIVFSRETQKKVAAVDELHTEDLIIFSEELQSARGNEHGFRLKDLLAQEGIIYEPYPKEPTGGKDSQPVKEWQRMESERFQIELALYERAALGGNIKSFVEEWINKGIHEPSAVIQRVEERMRINSDLGYRLRGPQQKGDKLVWDDLIPQVEDIAHIAIPVKPGERYSVISFNGH